MVDPLNGEAWICRGQAANGQGDSSAAVDHFWNVPDSDSYAIQAMTEVSKLSFGQLNDPLKGVAACERLLRFNPRNGAAHEALIGFYASTLQRGKLSDQIRVSVEAQVEPREAYIYDFLLQTLGSADAVPIIEHWMQRYPDNEALLVARVLQRQDESSASTDSSMSSPTDQSDAGADRFKLEQVEELRKRFPSNPELLAFVGENCIATGDIEGAIEILSQVSEAAGNDGRFWRLKGWVHESQDQLDEAAAAYHRALELHATDWNTMNRLAVVERHRQNISEVERLTKLVERANQLRQYLRKNGTTPKIPPAVFVELAQFYQDCGDTLMGPALQQRLEKANVLPRR